MNTVQISISAIFISTAIAAAAGQCPAPTAVPESVLLQVNAKAQIYGSGEHKQVEVHLTNTSSSPIAFFSTNVADAGGWFYRVKVIATDGAPVQETRLGALLNGHVSPAEMSPKEKLRLAVRDGGCTTIAPGQTMTHEVDLSLLYDLHRSGTYTVVVSVPALESFIRTSPHLPLASLSADKQLSFRNERGEKQAATKIVVSN